MTRYSFELIVLGLLYGVMSASSESEVARSSKYVFVSSLGFDFVSVLSRSIFCAVDRFIAPVPKSHRGLVRTEDVKALIAMQAHLVMLCLVGITCAVLLAPDFVAHTVSAFLGVAFVFGYTCLGARWAFQYKGAQRAKKIYASFWKYQIFKFIVVVTFSFWACVTPWVEPVSALGALAVMQCAPLCAGLFSPSRTVA